MFIYQSWIVLERTAKESDSLVCELINKITFVHPSNMEHVNFRVNLPRPLGKAKYYLMTDSELVPWGKGEKNPGRGVK
jgi:hypothetical protein